MLELRELEKAWPDFRLSISLSLSRGEIGAILGPSGSGKSTLLRIIAGLERADSGAIIVEGRDVTAIPPERRGIGMVFQDYALFPHLSVRENIEYGPHMRGMPRRARAEKVQALAGSFEIGELLERSPRSLSGGEQQRVALARALAADPAIILLDEPLSSLDAALRRRLRAEIAAGLRKAGTTALLVTHDAEEAFAIADRIFLVRSGSLEAEGPPERLYESPPSAWSASFLGRGPVIEINRLDEGETEPIARTAIGDFRCARPATPMRREKGTSEALFLFFPASKPHLVQPDAKAPFNRIRGKVASTSFAGYCRRLSLNCPIVRGEGIGKELNLELEIPPDVAPNIGECLELDVSPESCFIVNRFTKDH
jgi:ABC-type Fe3+/spermidine/putrescine transport system ATPase subunit